MDETVGEAVLEKLSLIENQLSAVLERLATVEAQSAATVEIADVFKQFGAMMDAGKPITAGPIPLLRPGA